MAPKRKQSAIATRQSSRLAKKARIASPEPKVESPSSTPPISAAAFSVHGEQENGRGIDDIDGTDADDESGDADDESGDADDEVSMHGDDDAEVFIKEEQPNDDDSGMDASNKPLASVEDGANDAEVPDKESDITDSDDYRVDSEDPYWEKTLNARFRNDKHISPICAEHLLIRELRNKDRFGQVIAIHEGHDDWEDERLGNPLGTNRLPNLVKRNGETIVIPLELWLIIFESLDEITGISVSLTNIFNFGIFNDLFGETKIYMHIPLLLEYRPVEKWEKGIFDKPFPFAPALNMKICLRDVIHTWFPQTLTWVHWGEEPIYHGPESLKIIKRDIRRAQGDKRRIAFKRYNRRHDERREAKSTRQQARKFRLELREARRQARFDRVTDEHIDDPDYSDGHDCYESNCAFNYRNAHNRSTYQSSGRDSDTGSEVTDAVMEDVDDGQGDLTEDSEIDAYQP